MSGWSFEPNSTYTKVGKLQNIIRYYLNSKYTYIKNKIKNYDELAALQQMFKLY